MKLQNFKELAQTEERRVALTLAETALQAIDTRSVMYHNFILHGDSLIIAGEEIDLTQIERIFLVAVGKCSDEAAKVAEDVLNDRITDGVVLCLGDSKFKKMKSYCGTHPFPTVVNVEATGEIIKMLNGMTKRDLVVFLISGGGSTLLCQPQGMTCENERDMLRTFFDRGATIEEINLLRKHISLARGGFLAQYAHPARIVSLIFSDVPGNDIAYVASGPTVRDLSTIEDAKNIMKRYGIADHVLEGSLLETPKDEVYFRDVRNVVVVSNEIALRAMQEKARLLGYEAYVHTSTLSGEARDMAIEITKQLHDAPPHTIHLYGGETTVTVTKPGKGGRGLEFVLSATREVRDGEVVLSLATDGRDNTEFAGALCDIMTRENALKSGLDPQKYLEDNASFAFFESLKDFLLTGSTGSNVSDLIICVKK